MTTPAVVVITGSMRQIHTLTKLFLFGSLFILPFLSVGNAHQSGCHRWHSCPSDSGSYICGDLGYCSQCPNNQFCQAGSPIPPPAPPTPPVPPVPPVPDNPNIPLQAEPLGIVLCEALRLNPDSVDTTGFILGTEGNDTLAGTDGPDIIIGLDGDDIIDGKGGDDIICSGEGNDNIVGGQGNNKIDGEGGNDRIVTDVVTNNPAGSLIEGGFDTAFGGPGNDVMFGGRHSDLLYGNDGNDVVFGSEGNDTVFGGPGNDAIGGGSRYSFLDGGPGYDSMTTPNGAICIGGDYNPDNFDEADSYAGCTLCWGYGKLVTPVRVQQRIDCQNLQGDTTKFETERELMLPILLP